MIAYMDRLSALSTEQYRQLESLELMRILQARASKPNGVAPEAYYRQHFLDSVLSSMVMKAFETERAAVDLEEKGAVPPATTLDPAWGGSLATARFADGFAQLVRDASVLAKLAVMPVPFSTPILTQIAGASLQWIGQGSPKPVTKIGLGSVTVDPKKCGGIVILSRELVRSTAPASARAMRSILVHEITVFVDQTFLSATPATPSSPGGILAGVTSSPNVDAALTAFLAARPRPLAPVVIASPSSLGAVTLDWQGRLRGIEVAVSPAAGDNIIIVDAAAIALADDGVALDVSNQAAIEMVDTPGTPTAATVFTSLWQDNLSGIRIERVINWQLTAVGAVAFTTKAP